jgi:phage terminase large subunit-like protein
MAPITFKLYRKQKQFLDRTALFIGFTGGRGSGKSTIGAYKFLRQMQSGRRYMIGVPSYGKWSDSTEPVWKDVCNRLGIRWTWTDKQHKIFAIPHAGVEVYVRSADDPDSFRGPNLSGIWLDEAAMMCEAAWQTCLPCLREGETVGWCHATFTPQGRLHWTFAAFGSGKPDTCLVQASTRENPFLPPGFYETMKAQLPPLLVQQELDGLFVDLQGALWPSSYFDWPGLWFDEWPPLDQLPLRIVACDPSLGTDARRPRDGHPGDWQAIVKYGRTKLGLEYVEADLSRRPVQAPRAADGTPLGEGMVETLVATARDFQAHGVGLEINQFQLLLSRMLLAEMQRQNCTTPLFELLNTDPKILRVLRLTNPLSEKRMRFKANSLGTRMLVDQARVFPVGDHDDGIDALEQARRVAVKLHNEVASR